MTSYCLDARAATDDRFPGVGRYARNLASALSGEIVDGEHLLLLRDRVAFAEPTATGRVRSVSLESRVFSLAHHWRVRSVLRAEQIDLYHSPYFLLPIAIGAPCVVSIHDLIPFRYPQYFPPMTRAVLRFAIRRAARVARSVLTLSKASKSDLERFLGLDSSRIAVTPLAAEPSFTPRPAEEIAAVRARLGLPDRYVLSIGADRPHKNFARLIEAWHRLQPRAETLAIAGAADARYPGARRRSQELNLGRAVRFLGPVAEKDLAALYSGADLFVFPSEWEGFGLPVAEAMACGVAVACSSAEALVELTADEAALFSPLDVESIAQTIGALLDDRGRRLELARRGAERAARFSWAATARATIAAYRAALAPR